MYGLRLRTENNPLAAILFTVNDKVLPSYVRRTIERYSRIILNIEEPYLIKIARESADILTRKKTTPIRPPTSGRAVITIIINPNEKDEEK